MKPKYLTVNPKHINKMWQ